jgi:plastocyanin
MLSITILTIFLPLISSAQSHTVKVGNDGLNIEPDVVRAGVGDTITFDFYPKNHSIAQSSWDKPCEPLSSDGDTKPIFSGFFPVGDYEEVQRGLWKHR